jgi:hypothetical protein
MDTGIARIHENKSGALSVYIDSELGPKITLPKSAKLKTSWDNENKRIIIEEM